MSRLRAIFSSVAFLLPTVADAQPNFEFYEPVKPPRPVQLMVHRGLSTSVPENSALAIQLCRRDFCEWAEIDVRLTKDGRHVIIHDDTVNATTNGTGRVDELTLEEIQKLDTGSWFAKRFTGNRILTLSEALDFARGKVNLYLDCKQIDPKQLVDELLSHEMASQVIVYASPTVLNEVKIASNDTIARMAKYGPTTAYEQFVKEVAPAAVEIDADEISATIVRQFHAAGIKVQAKVLGEKWDKPQVWESVIDAGVDWLQTDAPAALRFFDTRRRIGKFPVMIACHRGANQYAPENTLPAIREAALLGVDFTEIDFRTTRDGKIVLMHDATVNRTTDGTGPVRDYLFADVTALHGGLWFGGRFRDIRVPSLDDALSAFGPTMSAYLDAKDISPDALITAIQAHGLWERHVVYQSLDYCGKLRSLAPNVRTLPPLKRLDQLDAVAAIQPFGVDAAWSILSKEMIDDCHKRGIKVFSDALGLNETVDQYRKAIEWGIDCIQTDHPVRVLRAIELFCQNHTP